MFPPQFSEHIYPCITSVHSCSITMFKQGTLIPRRSSCSYWKNGSSSWMLQHQFSTLHFYHLCGSWGLVQKALHVKASHVLSILAFPICCGISLRKWLLKCQIYSFNCYPCTYISRAKNIFWVSGNIKKLCSYCDCRFLIPSLVHQLFVFFFSICSPFCLFLT